jgi:hypothetical protein|tara:strand:- start:737 stop:1117 length:381 start_codon:yes stop_codon:yes gene_type:complete
MKMADRYPKTKQGGLWRNENADPETNKQPPYRGHLVITEEMLKTLVVLMRNNAWENKGQNPDLGPRINLAAWLNTAKDSGEKYFRINGDVYYSKEHNHLFDGSEETPATPAPAPKADTPDDDDFPF